MKIRATPSATFNLGRLLRTLSLFCLLVGCSSYAILVQATAQQPLRRQVLRLQAHTQSEMVQAPDGKSLAESFTLDSSLADSLLSVAVDGTAEVTDWPVAAGLRRNVLLQRYNIYAAGAQVFKVEGNQHSELPRSRLVFFRGSAEGDSSIHLSIAVDPDTGRFQGLSQSLAGLQELRATPQDGLSSLHQIAPKGAFRSAGLSSGRVPSWSCGEMPYSPEPPKAPEGARAALAPEAALNALTVAVDTDNELIQLKFANNTTNATNYLAALFAGLNVIYERDLNIRLLQGTTYLRVAADPYVELAPGNAAVRSAQLTEFATYWSNYYGGVTRGIAAMISGKQTEDYAGSGRAYVNNSDTGAALCSTSIGYSFSQVYKYPGSTAADDVQLVAHEIGHNFGSPHTHCYSPPVDTCVNFESCYTGATSCPAAQTINNIANVRGTLMSYCHLLGGCGVSLVFHPTSVATYMGPGIASRQGQCVSLAPTTQSSFFMPIVIKSE